MEKISAKFIIEILGRPAEHLMSSLTDLVAKIGTEKGVSVVSKTINKPKPVEKTDNLWTAFADVELTFDKVPLFFNTIMTYMPAHVEVFDPETLKFNTFELNELANFIVGRLHNYDALAKRLMSEREILIRKLEHLRNGGKLEDVFPKKEKSVAPSQIDIPKEEENIGKKKKSKKK